jgi:ABC-type multidrug transport system fused ATPase/permease subunit
MAVTGQSIIYDLRRELFDHLQTLSLGFFSRYAVGRLISRVINDVNVLRELITWALVAVARDLFDLFGTLAAMFLLNWQLTALSLTVLPLMVVATEIFRRRARANYRKRPFRYRLGQRGAQRKHRWCARGAIVLARRLQLPNFRARGERQSLARGRIAPR